MPREKKMRGPSFVAEDCLSCIHTNGSRQTQARSATGHVRYNYQHLAYKALHCIRYERACRSAWQCSHNIFSSRPQLRFYDILDGQNVEFLRSCIDDIGKSTIKNGGLYYKRTFGILSVTYLLLHNLREPISII